MLFVQCVCVLLRLYAACRLHGDTSRDVLSVLNVSVSRRSRDVFWNVSSESSRLGLEDITSQSRSRDFSLVNNPLSALETFATIALYKSTYTIPYHQACGYIMKKIMDLTRKKQVVK